MNPKFEGFVKKYILEELKSYKIKIFEMHTADYGVPQRRRRIFFVGFRSKKDFARFTQPEGTHSWDRFKKLKDNKAINSNIFDFGKPNTMGVRESLGLPDLDFDNLAPTIRSTFTGKRNTTSILNSSASQKTWGDMEIWASGVQSNRQKA